jgi:uncharacterized protein
MAREAITSDGICETASVNEAARNRLLGVRGEPLLIADWLKVVFIHFEVEAGILQKAVPFELDLRDGRAYVSLVAFTMRNMRPRVGGKLAALLFKPIANNHFMNVRTYVRQGSETGIYFMAEWLNNPLSVRLGPAIFGLPYRYGNLNYEHDYENGVMSGQVTERTKTGAALKYRAAFDVPAVGNEFQPCEPGSLDEFLLERYTAFNGKPAQGSAKKFFRIWHQPWPNTRLEATMLETGLLQKVWPWFREAKLIGANYSLGVRGVWMGRPHRLAEPASGRFTFGRQ